MMHVHFNAASFQNNAQYYLVYIHLENRSVFFSILFCCKSAIVKILHVHVTTIYDEQGENKL